MARKQAPTVDICLLLEGTYPYVSGGVSTWVHQLISAYPEWQFGIFLLGGQRDPAATYKYAVPANVVVIEELYLFDPADYRPSALHRAVPSSWSGFFTALRKLFVRLPDGTQGDTEILSSLLQHIMQQRSITFEDFYHSQRTWDVLRELYDRYAADDSFIHFFWTCRYLIEPLWKLARALPRVPKAKLYHSACTGYAGFLGAILAHQTGIPLLLSEHGIYLKERIQDICRSPWIPEFTKLRPTLVEPLGSLRRLWIGFFDVLGRICYQESAHLVSLFAKNASVQRHFGADPDKISIVPNGIAFESLEILHTRRVQRQQEDHLSRVVGFLGRVVTIKDVKTLLRAARLVCDVLPDAQFLIAGPTEEEPEYYTDCVELARQLQIDSNVQFLGLQKRDDVLPLMDVMVLTSISEGLPFVVLEAMAAGIPLVSTDVGACRELLEGRADEQPALGPCGIVTEIGNTDQIARALVRLLEDRALQDTMSRTGRQRALQHYHERDTLEDYRQIYQQLMNAATPKLERSPAPLVTKPTPAPHTAKPLPSAQPTLAARPQPATVTKPTRGPVPLVARSTPAPAAVPAAAPRPVSVPSPAPQRPTTPAPVPVPVETVPAETVAAASEEPPVNEAVVPAPEQSSPTVANDHFSVNDDHFSVAVEHFSVNDEPQSVAAESQSVAVEPQSVAIEPQSVAVEPPSVAVEPQSVAIEPPSVTVEPPAVTEDVPIPELNPRRDDAPVFNPPQADPPCFNP